MRWKNAHLHFDYNQFKLQSDIEETDGEVLHAVG